jgi:hypothetical protein
MHHLINHGLKIVEGKRGVGPYLRCYRARCILSGEALPCHLIMRQEDLIHLLVTGLKRLVILLRQVVECKLDDVVLIDVRYIYVGTSFLHS